MSVVRFNYINHFVSPWPWPVHCLESSCIHLRGWWTFLLVPEIFSSDHLLIKWSLCFLLWSSTWSRSRYELSKVRPVGWQTTVRGFPSHCCLGSAPFPPWAWASCLWRCWWSQWMIYAAQMQFETMRKITWEVTGCEGDRQGRWSRDCKVDLPLPSWLHWGRCILYNLIAIKYSGLQIL